MDNAVISDEAAQALTLPRDFAYFGDLDLGTTWGFTGVSVHRDSDVLDQSNWDTIKDDLLEQYPDDFHVLSSSHWAVGWCDQLLVRVLDDEGCETPAFEAVLEWSRAMADYPVADEEDYSRREREEFIEGIEFAASPVKEDAPEDWAEQIASRLFDTHSACRMDDVSYEDIDEASEALGFRDPDW